MKPQTRELVTQSVLTGVCVYIATNFSPKVTIPLAVLALGYVALDTRRKGKPFFDFE